MLFACFWSHLVPRRFTPRNGGIWAPNRLNSGLQALVVKGRLSAFVLLQSPKNERWAKAHEISREFLHLMLVDDECLFFCLAWAPHSISPQSSSKIFFKRFLEILLQQSDELRKLGEFTLLNAPLISRINTTKYALHFPFNSRGRLHQFPHGNKMWCCDCVLVVLTSGAKMLVPLLITSAKVL